MSHLVKAKQSDMEPIPSKQLWVGHQFQDKRIFFKPSKAKRSQANPSKAKQSQAKQSKAKQSLASIQFQFQSMVEHNRISASFTIILILPPIILYIVILLLY